MFFTIKESTRKNKKFMAIFEDKTIVHFGSKGYGDFTINQVIERKNRYIARHQHEDWTNFKNAGALSRYILWNKLTLHDSIKDYERRFNLTFIG